VGFSVLLLLCLLLEEIQHSLQELSLRCSRHFIPVRRGEVVKMAMVRDG